MIYIGDDLLDLDPSTVITISIQAIDVGDLKTRNVSYTNQLKVPLTENNCRIFGYVHSEWSRSVVPYQFNSCKIVQNGIQTMKGICILKRFDGSNFILNIYEDLFDIFKALDGKTLKDIDPIPDSIWDETEMDDERDSTDGIISAIYLNGNGTIFDSDFFLPSFYYHTIITKILEFTGLTVEGSIFSDSRFTDLVIPWPGDEFDYTASISVPSFVAKGTKDEDTGSSVDPAFMAGITSGDILIIQVLNIQSTVGSVGSASGFSTMTEQTFTWGTIKFFYKVADGTETGTINISRSGSSGGMGDFMMAQIYQISGNTITLEDIEVSSDQLSTITWSAVTVGGAGRSLFALVTDYDGAGVSGPSGYSLEATDNSVGVSGATMAIFSKENVSSDGSVTGSGSSNGWGALHLSVYGANPFNVDWNLWWPDVQVTDLLKDFFTRFAAIPRQVDNRLIIKTIEEIISDRSTALNWSAKLTKTKKPIDFTTQYAQENYFEYNNENNDETLGRGSLDIDNETLKPSGTVFSSVFETCETTQAYRSAVIEFYDDTSVDNTDIKESPGLKLLTLRDADGDDDPITFLSTPRSDYKVAYFVDPALPKDTKFQYFIDEFYAGYREALQKNKVIEKEYLLTELDIINYNSHKMIYDAEGYYLINKIKNFIPDQVTTVELFKVG